MIRFKNLYCRKCNAKNPVVYYAPVVTEKCKIGTCICLNCVKINNWLDGNENLKQGIEL